MTGQFATIDDYIVTEPAEKDLMNTMVSNRAAARLSLPAGRLAIGASAVALILLASLHVLSPEFDPSWRMVSEYANGRFGWVLSLMFAAWGVGSLALACAIWSEAKTTLLKIGLGALVLAGIGEAMAAVFDINNDALHSLAGALGIVGLPVAAMLISVNLGRTSPWCLAKRTLMWTANLTWVSVLLLAATLALLMVTFSQIEGGLPTQAPEVLPPGVIGLVGWANRLLVVVYCVWVIAVAWKSIKLRTAPRKEPIKRSCAAAPDLWDRSLELTGGDRSALLQTVDVVRHGQVGDELG